MQLYRPPPKQKKNRALTRRNALSLVVVKVYTLSSISDHAIPKSLKCANSAPKLDILKPQSATP